MPKTYLLRIDDEETWRKFHSLCALKGIKIKDAIWSFIKGYVENQEGRKVGSKKR